MAEIKIDKKSLVKSAKESARPNRKNVTFRFNIELYDAFKRECERQGVSPTDVTESFFKVFIER